MNLMVFFQNLQFDPPTIRHKRVLEYPAAKFDKTYQHPGLTSYNRKIGQVRFLLTNFEIQDFLISHIILLKVFLL